MIATIYLQYWLAFLATWRVIISRSNSSTTIGTSTQMDGAFSPMCSPSWPHLRAKKALYYTKNFQAEKTDLSLSTQGKNEDLLLETQSSLKDPTRADLDFFSQMKKWRKEKASRKRRNVVRVIFQAFPWQQRNDTGITLRRRHNPPVDFYINFPPSSFWNFLN